MELNEDDIYHFCEQQNVLFACKLLVNCLLVCIANANHFNSKTTVFTNKR